MLSLFALFLRALVPAPLMRWVRMKRAQRQAAAIVRRAQQRYGFAAGLQARSAAPVSTRPRDPSTTAPTPALRELTQEKLHLTREARDIVDAAEAEYRDLTQEEQNRWDALMGEIDAIDLRVERQNRLASLETGMRQSRGVPPGAREPVDDGRSREHETATGDRRREDENRAFRKYLQGAPAAAFTEREQRALQMDSDIAGGFLVAPQDFVARIILFVKDFVYLRQLGTVMTVTNAESLGVPSLDADPADSNWTAEIATGSEDASMIIGKRELRPHPLAKRIKISNKLIRASTMDPEALVIDRLGYKFAITMEKAYLNGTGAEQPLGLFTASNLGIDTSRDVGSGLNTTTSIQADGLIQAKYSLKAAYWDRPSTCWLFSRQALMNIRKLKDANGQYLWAPGVAGVRVGDIAAGIPNTIVDTPYHISEYVPNTFTTGLYVGIIGDMSFVWIADAMQLQIQRLIELYAEQNQVGLIGRLETDGMPVLAEAFVRVILS